MRTHGRRRSRPSHRHPEYRRAAKLTVSLSPTDLAVLDDYVRRTGLPSRSAAIKRAIGMLAHPQLEQDYAAAWTEWDESGDREAWEGTGT